MSFKDKAREIREHGAKKRGTYTPEADSAPVRLYARWAKIRPKKVRERENFCHYWRVVLFWAPLWVVLHAVGSRISRVANAVEDYVKRNEKFWLFVAGFVVLAILAGLTAGGAPAWAGAFFVLMVLYGIISIFFGFIALVEYDMANLDKLREDDFIDALFIFFPSFLVIGLFKVPYVVGRWVHSKAPAGIGSLLGKVGIVLGGLVVAAVVGYAFIFHTMIALYALAAVVGFAVAGFVLLVVGDALSNHFKRAKEARTKVVTEVIDYGDFSYEKEKTVVEPGRIAKFFMAIGDFLNVGIQAVRVNKWKICPIVEIPKVTNEQA